MTQSTSRGFLDGFDGNALYFQAFFCLNALLEYDNMGSILVWVHQSQCATGQVVATVPAGQIRSLVPAVIRSKAMHKHAACVCGSCADAIPKPQSYNTLREIRGICHTIIVTTAAVC